MIAMCCVVVGFLVNLMSGCVAPLSNWQTSNEKHGYEFEGRKESNEGESLNKEMKQVGQEAKPVPEIPSPNRLRVPEKISSSALRNQQEDMNNSENYDEPARLVQLQTEVHPIASTSHETSDSKYESLTPIFDNLEPDNNNDCSNNEKTTKKLPSIRRKMKYMMRIFICSRNEKSMTVNGFETDESQRLNHPAAQSTMIKESEQVNVSSPTKISASTLQETRPRDSESREKNKEQLSSRTEALREMVTLINRQSIDVRINGLTMNQSDLLDMFEATEGKARSVSMVPTEDEQIITMKFYRRKNGNETVQTEDDSQTQSGAPNRIIPLMYVSHYSINDTSYTSFPKMTKNASNCSARRGTRRKIFWKTKIT